MEIIKDLNPGIGKYKFTHWNCCEFTAFENEFKWVVGKYNETTASVVCKDDDGNELGATYSSGFDLPDKVCPKCGEQFYDDPILIDYKK